MGMEEWVKVVSALVSVILGASGIFASTGVLELFRTVLNRAKGRHEGAVFKRAGDGIRTIPVNPATPSDEDPNLILKDTNPWGPHGPKLNTGTIVLPKDVALPKDDVKASSSNANASLFLAVLLVVCVFAISIGVIWSLTHMGGPIEASVKTTIEKAGGSILIVGSGLFGAFFAVSILAFGAIHVFSKRSE
jgi:hypothetical protein